MVIIGDLAQAALARQSLKLRSLAQDLLLAYPRLSDVPPPTDGDRRAFTVAAALLDLLAAHTDQPSAPWTRQATPLDKPFFLVAAAERMKNLRAICMEASPEPLRSRGLFAPPNFLMSA